MRLLSYQKGDLMYVFKIDNMSCKSCLHNITDALSEVDSNVKVSGELEKKLISVESNLDPTQLEEVIREAGYKAQRTY